MADGCHALARDHHGASAGDVCGHGDGAAEFRSSAVAGEAFGSGGGGDVSESSMFFFSPIYRRTDL